MGVTKIEWTRGEDGSPGRTWNPTRGCSMAKGSELGGCLNCYAAAIAVRFKELANGKPGPFHLFARRTENGPRWTGKVGLVEDKLTDPLHWRKPARIFVNSMSDLFHEGLPFSAIDKVFTAMIAADWHTYLILTKRADRMLEYFRSGRHDGGIGPDRATYHLDQKIWLGVSVENQQTADARIPLLLQTPAAVRFVSYEPALEFVDFAKFHPNPYQRLPGGYRGDRPELMHKIDQIIVGAESGPGARFFDEDWARFTRDHCVKTHTAFFYKQSATLGGRKIPTPELDGQRWMQYPEPRTV